MMLDTQALLLVRLVLKEFLFLFHRICDPAYQIPIENIADTASLRCRGICLVQTAGSGRTRRKRSMATFPAPWNTTRRRVREHVSETKAARKSSCETPSEGEGAHMTAKAMDSERWKDMMNTMPAIEAIRIQFRTLKICKYNIRTEVLTAQMANGAIISTRRASLNMGSCQLGNHILERLFLCSL
jgi:hypothetical protein